MPSAALTAVRDAIDRIDRSIIDLMAERGRFVREAARYKTTRAEVEAPQRVEEVVAKVRAMAEASNLDPGVAETTYRAMIRAFIEVEHGALLAEPSLQEKP